MSEHEVITEEEGEVKVNLAPSLRDALIQKRERAAKNLWVDLDIPGYDSKLFCRYNLVDSARLNAIGNKITRTIKDQDERAVAAAIDTLIAACEQLFVRYEGREIPLNEVIGQEEPVRYDAALAEYLKFTDELPDPPTARSVVKALFINNEIAIAAHNVTLSRWMMGNESSLDDEFLEDPL